jgi:hypothetical protein
VTETEEQRLEREDAEIAKKTFAGADGEIVQRTVEDSVSMKMIRHRFYNQMCQYRMYSLSHLYANEKKMA